MLAKVQEVRPWVLSSRDQHITHLGMMALGVNLTGQCTCTKKHAPRISNTPSTLWSPGLRPSLNHPSQNLTSCQQHPAGTSRTVAPTSTSRSPTASPSAQGLRASLAGGRQYRGRSWLQVWMTWFVQMSRAFFWHPVPRNHSYWWSVVWLTMHGPSPSGKTDKHTQRMWSVGHIQARRLLVVTQRPTGPWLPNLQQPNTVGCVQGSLGPDTLGDCFKKHQPLTSIQCDSRS